MSAAQLDQALTLVRTALTAIEEAGACSTDWRVSDRAVEGFTSLYKGMVKLDRVCDSSSSPGAQGDAAEMLKRYDHVWPNILRFMAAFYRSRAAYRNQCVFTLKKLAAFSTGFQAAQKAADPSDLPWLYAPAPVDSVTSLPVEAEPAAEPAQTRPRPRCLQDNVEKDKAQVAVGSVQRRSTVEGGEQSPGSPLEDFDAYVRLEKSEKSHPSDAGVDAGQAKHSAPNSRARQSTLGVSLQSTKGARELFTEGMETIAAADFVYPSGSPIEAGEKLMEGFESLRKGVTRMHCKFTAVEVEADTLDTYDEVLRTYDDRWKELIEFIVGVYENRPKYSSRCVNLVEELSIIWPCFRSCRVARRPLLPWLLHTTISEADASWGVQYYDVRCVEGGVTTHAKKRFNDFRDFDLELRTKYSDCSPEGLPALPDSGLVGFRHRLGLMSFNERRLEGLQAYLDHLAASPETMWTVRQFVESEARPDR